ncbi:MAG: DUF349 domain-containing protein [Bacteroidetes bacterium]|nr:MAG: DUF349 domain-containing protein [Bacteroidota bacterium]
MKGKELLLALENLLGEEQVIEKSQEANELKTTFLDFVRDEEMKLQQGQGSSEEEEESEGRDISPEEQELKELKDQFFEQYEKFRERLASEKSALKLEQEANLRLKKSFIDRLKKLVEEEENIGAALAEYRKIHEAWKEVGDIPRDSRQEVQSEYSRLLESFFFNIKIYRELKDHDLKRNLQLKQEVVEKLQALDGVESVKDLESSIKALQNEFEETGPVPQEEWETLKQTYWDQVRKIYTRIQAHYDERREQMRSNIEKKQALLEQVDQFLSELGEPDSAKSWDQQTKRILEFQEEWKKVGFGTRKENEELWKQFRERCDRFFAQKKVFFDGLKESFNQVADQKQKLIEKAHGLKESTDWKETSAALIRLQKEWKQLGSAGQRLEHGLWKDFRAACDHFFDARKAHFDREDKQNEENLEAKKALISEMEAYQLPADKKQALEDLKAFSKRFSEIGKVPFKQKDKVYEGYKTCLDGLYQQMKLEGEEKEKVMFQAHLDTIKASPKSDHLLEKERREIRQKIDKLRQEINLFENNLGFLANSKGAESLRKDVEKKIRATEEKIKEYRSKLKMLVHE